MDDTFETLEDDDLEEEAGEAVEAILFEVTKGETQSILQTAGSVVLVCVYSDRCVHSLQPAPLIHDGTPSSPFLSLVLLHVTLPLVRCPFSR